MNRFQFRVTLRVLAIHVGVVGFLLLQSLLHGCFQPKPKPEIVTFIEFGEPAPPVEIQEVAEMTPVEPESAVQEPPPVELPVPEPPKVEPVKRKVDPPKKEVVKPAPTKPRTSDWKPVKASDIDPSKSKRVNDTPAKPAITKTDIQRELSGIVQPGNPDETAAYIAKVGNYFDRYWKQPPSASTELSTVVRVYFDKSGKISSRRKIQGSGDAEFDQSVMDTVNSVGSVPKPPVSFPFDYVEVEFRIRN